MHPVGEMVSLNRRPACPVELQRQVFPGRGNNGKTGRLFPFRGSLFGACYHVREEKTGYSFTIFPPGIRIGFSSLHRHGMDLPQQGFHFGHHRCITGISGQVVKFLRIGFFVV